MALLQLQEITNPLYLLFVCIFLQLKKVHELKHFATIILAMASFNNVPSSIYHGRGNQPVLNHKSSWHEKVSCYVSCNSFNSFVFFFRDFDWIKHELFDS